MCMTFAFAPIARPLKLGVMKVHYPSFDSEILLSAGNDKRLLVWDQRQFILSSDASSSNNSCRDGRSGGGGSGASNGSGANSADSKTRKSAKSGKKKGRSKNIVKHESTAPPPTAGQSRNFDAGNEIKEGREKRPGDGAAKSADAGSRDASIVRCSVPLLSMRLEEKPNWVSSFGVPYPAIVVADTSSVAKILRTRGS